MKKVKDTKSAYEKAVANAMKELRLRRGYKREYLSNSIGISVALYSKLDQGKVQVKYWHVSQFCAAMGINLLDFEMELTAQMATKEHSAASR